VQVRMKMEGDRASRLLGPKRCSGRPWWSRRLCYAVHMRPNAVKEAKGGGRGKGPADVAGPAGGGGPAGATGRRRWCR
jgi:hypothetical protein